MRVFRKIFLPMVGFVSLAAIAGIFFQNCGKAGFEAGVMDDSSITGSVTGEAVGAPFAFNATFDQISYNSCAMNGLNTNPGYFTFYAGAYDNGGISINNEFINYARSTLKPIYPSSTVSDEQIKQLLSESPANVNSMPQFSTRLRTDVIRVVTKNDANPTENIDYINFFGDLTDDRYMDPMMKGKPAAINYFPLGPSNKKRMEAKLQYNIMNDTDAQVIRSGISNSGMLSLTFNTNAGNTQSIKGTQAGDAAKAQGKGYYLTFSNDKAYYTSAFVNASAPPHALNPNNVLATIQEVDLSRPGVASNAVWNCNPTRRYVIMRRADAALCPAEVFPNMNDANYRRELEIVRRHLKAEYWDVNITKRCAVPKEQDCYPSETLNGQQIGIMYDQTQPCFQNGVNYGSQVPVQRCAQYVSICIRN